VHLHVRNPKPRINIDDVEMLAKRDVPVKWCVLATEYTSNTGGKPWRYALIPMTSSPTT
jgi:type III restriction enzyme